MQNAHILLFLSFLAQWPPSEGKNQVMVWMCLDICGQGGQNASKHLEQFSHHLDVVSAVSFEKYTLGPNASLVTFDITEVADNVSALGVESWPMLSSWPHPPEFMEWMREAFEHPDKFIAQCISEAQKYNYTGYNLDWEPTEDVTESDGAAYAAFVETFAQGLHDHGIKLSVDIASWSPIWNFDLLAQTSADSFISMVGLETVNASTEERMPMEEVKWRFDSVNELDVQMVALWKSPVPPLWWPLLVDFTTR